MLSTSKKWFSHFCPGCHEEFFVDKTHYNVKTTCIECGVDLQRKSCENCLCYHNINTPVCALCEGFSEWRLKDASGKEVL